MGISKKRPRERRRRNGFLNPKDPSCLYLISAESRLALQRGVRREDPKFRALCRPSRRISRCSGMRGARTPKIRPLCLSLCCSALCGATSKTGQREGKRKEKGKEGKCLNFNISSKLLPNYPHKITPIMHNSYAVILKLPSNTGLNF